MSDYLPEEILIKILVKLPVKSLIRGTSVCRQWRSLIRSPSFISTHISNTQNQALLRRYDNSESQDHYMVIPKRGPFDINSEYSVFEFTLECQMCYFKIVGSCDGLVCLSDGRIIIWNPAIRNHVVLPQPLVNPNESHHVVLGFGVAKNVYKVVRLVDCQRNPNGDGFNVPPQAEIFCLGTRRWRKLTGFDVKGLVPLYPWYCPIFFEGFVHWIAYDPIGQRNSILRFHIGNEVFGETMLPRELERGALLRSLSLAVMGESLGAIKYDMCNERCDVWMMKDYGVKESWTKLYRIDFRGFERVIGFWGSGEALVVVQGRELATYNRETKGIKRVGVLGYISSFYVNIDYKESLVLLGGYSGDSGDGLS